MGSIEDYRVNITNEEILALANAHFQDRKKNTLPTFTFMTVDEELIAFARLIEQATREADARICLETPHKAREAGNIKCAEAIRRQK